MVEANRTCPKCLSDNVEKVGWNYWYCNECTDIWQIVAAAGGSRSKANAQSAWNESRNLPQGGAKGNTEKRSKDGKFKRQTQQDQSLKQLPQPGSLEPYNGMDYPS